MKPVAALLAVVALAIPSHAALLAYYNFDQAGDAGLINQVTGGTPIGNGAYIGDAPTITGAGAGFSGNAAYQGAVATNTTNRSTLLVGNALNVVKANTGTADGQGDFNVSTLSPANLAGNFTISAWFNLIPDADNTSTTADIARDYVFETTPTEFDVSFGTTTATGTIYASYVGGTPTGGITASLANSTWHNVVHSFSTNGSNITLSIYLDGQFVGSQSTASSAMNWTGGINFGSARGGIRVFDGLIDEVGVWNVAADAASAAAIYQAGLDGMTLDTVTVVPEPSALGLLGLGALGLLRRRRN